MFRTIWAAIDVPCVRLQAVRLRPDASGGARFHLSNRVCFFLYLGGCLLCLCIIDAPALRECQAGDALLAKIWEVFRELAICRGQLLCSHYILLGYFRKYKKL